MDFNKLTIKAQEAIAAAQELARKRENPEIHPEHLTIALLDQELPQTLAQRAGSSAESLRSSATLVDRGGVRERSALRVHRL